MDLYHVWFDSKPGLSDVGCASGSMHTWEICGSAARSRATVSLGASWDLRHRSSASFT